MRHLCGLSFACVLLTVYSQAQEQPRSIALPDGTKVMRDVPYVQGGHERNKLDLYLPEKAEGVLPVVVWVHGGAWQGGSKEGCPAVFMVPRGYAVASINYRLSQHAPFPAQIEDCKAAIRWLRANAKKYHLDPNKIGAWGASAGGHLVALLGTAPDVKELEGSGGNSEYSSNVQAVCDWFGPTDFLRMDIQAGALGKMKHDAPTSPESRLIGGAIQENRDKVARANPITYVSKDDSPFLMMHGDQDPLVPIGQSELLAEALKKAGVEVAFKRLEGAGHGGPQFNSPENRKLILAFFDRHLRGPGK